MYTLHVKSLPFKDVLQDLAKELDTKVRDDCEVYNLKIPQAYGSGNIKGINFPMGIGLIHYSCTFKEDVVIKFDVSDVHPAKFLYCKSGYLRHCFLDSDDPHDLDEYQSAIVASKGTVGHQIQFKGGVKTEIGSLEIDRSQFKSQVACDLKKVNPALRKLFLDVNATSQFHHEGDYSATLSDVMTGIGEYPESGLPRRMYLHAKSLEILSEQIRQFSDDKRDKPNQSLLRQSELGKIKQIAEEIRNNLNEDHTILTLSVKTGLNENKLQAGFKVLYDLTVRGFIQKERMSIARDMLVNTEYSISEIVHLIGLSNGGYFSKLFRKEYGMAPADYRLMFGRTIIKRKKKS
jgi:AraC-like DNA-binding protein